MASIRALSLVTAAAALVAVPAYFAFAQPSDPKPAAPAATPKADPKPDATQPQPGGEGRPRRGPDGQPGGPGGPGRGGEGGGLPQSVNQSMKIMNRALKTLKDQASDATKKEENLKLVSDMQRGCLAAKGLTPDRAIGRAGADKKDEISVAYRRQLITMLEKLLKLESAIMDGKGSDAGKLIDEIETLRDAGHKELGVRD